MDFHCLTRKELQFLCKRNKIPANMTNLAMADALIALETVEGVEELRSQSQSPEKTMNKESQEIPSTVTRTSTRRKTIKEENQSSQSTIRTRKAARKVSETPVTATNTSRRVQKTEPEVKDQGKSDPVETPLQSCRGRPAVGSRRKVEPRKEGSVQTGYGTRRSVRLLEKGLAGLSLKESGKEEPVKVDEMAECEAGNNNDQSGVTSELPLARNLSSSLEDERECNNGESDGTVRTQAVVSPCEKNDEPEGEDKFADERECNNGESDGTLISEADVSSDVKIDEPKSEDKFANDTDGIIDSKGSDDTAVSKDSHEVLNLNEEPVADETNDFDASQEGYGNEVLNLNEEPGADETNDFAVSQKGYEVEALKLKEPVADETNDLESLKEEELVAEKSIEVLNANTEEILDDSSSADLTILPKAEEYADGQVSQNVSVLPEGHMDSSAEKRNEESDDDDAFLGDSDDVRSDSKSLAADDEDSDALDNSDTDGVMGSDSKSLAAADDNNDALDDSDIDDDKGSDIISAADELQEESDDDVLGDDTGSDSKSLADDPLAMVNEEAMVDAKVTEVGTIPESSFHNTSQSVAGDSEAMVDVCVMPAEEFADTAANSEIITSSVSSSSPLKAQFSQPRKSSSKKQTTIPKVTQPSDNINKENDIVKMELDHSQRKVKKNKNIIDKATMQNLEGMSLRNLKKLTQQFNKLEIADMNKEDDNPNKETIGKRTALQTLPQTSMNSVETVKLN